MKPFSRGVAYFGKTIANSDTRHAILMTGLTALIAVPVNTAFGVAAAWAITKFDFPGRRLLLIVIEIPFSVSPIVAGVAYLFVYGLQGLFGDALQSADVKILFALPGIVLASMFVTAPFVARELIPLMQAQGRDLEEAATLARGQRLADILLRHPAQYQMGAALRRHPVQLAGHG